MWGVADYRFGRTGLLLEENKNFKDITLALGSFFYYLV